MTEGPRSGNVTFSGTPRVYESGVVGPDLYKRFSTYGSKGCPPGPWHFWSSRDVSLPSTFLHFIGEKRPLPDGSLRGEDLEHRPHYTKGGPVRSRATSLHGRCLREDDPRDTLKRERQESSRDPYWDVSLFFFLYCRKWWSRPDSCGLGGTGCTRV